MGGLLRILRPGGNPDLVRWNAADGWRLDWPEAEGLVAFAYDWLGRLYGLDRLGAWGRAGHVVRLVPGTGDIEAADIALSDFLYSKLPADHEDLPSEAYWRDWLSVGGRPLATDECVGYRVPLFLGGEDDVPNLEIVPLRSYLSLCGQLASQAVDDGAIVECVDLVDDGSTRR